MIAQTGRGGKNGAVRASTGGRKYRSGGHSERVNLTLAVLDMILRVVQGIDCLGFRGKV